MSLSNLPCLGFELVVCRLSEHQHRWRFVFLDECADVSLGQPSHAGLNHLGSLQLDVLPDLPQAVPPSMSEPEIASLPPGYHEILGAVRGAQVLEPSLGSLTCLLKSRHDFFGEQHERFVA